MRGAAEFFNCLHFKKIQKSLLRHLSAEKYDKNAKKIVLSHKIFDISLFLPLINVEITGTFKYPLVLSIEKNV
jgi:hypothetical protein